MLVQAKVGDHSFLAWKFIIKRVGKLQGLIVW